MAQRIPWDKIEKTATCWNWYNPGPYGYGRIERDGKMQQVHRFIYQELIGPIPNGLVLDHLCRNRICVNIKHLEVVTQRENLLRGDTIPARNAKKTHCLHGHEFTPDNLVSWSKKRKCKTCERRRDARRRSVMV